MAGEGLGRFRSCFEPRQTGPPADRLALVGTPPGGRLAAAALALDPPDKATKPAHKRHRHRGKTQTPRRRQRLENTHTTTQRSSRRSSSSPRSCATCPPWSWSRARCSTASTPTSRRRRCGCALRLGAVIAHCLRVVCALFCSCVRCVVLWVYPCSVLRAARFGRTTHSNTYKTHNDKPQLHTPNTSQHQSKQGRARRARARQSRAPPALVARDDVHPRAVRADRRVPRHRGRAARLTGGLYVVAVCCSVLQCVVVCCSREAAVRR